MRAAWLAALLCLAPRVSLACSVCMSGREDENRLAFILTTVMLSVLPLLSVGGIVWWLRRRVRELAAREERERTGLPGRAIGAQLRKSA